MKPRGPGAVLAAALPVACLVAGCAAGADESGDGGPRIVAAHYVLGYVAERVAGDRADVETLTSPGQEPHDLELSLRDVAELAEADLVVYQSGFQSAVDEGADTADPDRVVDATEAVDRLKVGEDGAQHAPHAHAHEHGNLNPHFWLDPARLGALAEAVYDELADLDAPNANTYRTNVDDLLRDLDLLDEELRTGLGNCRRDLVVVSHDAFGYLGARYGLEFAAVNGLSPESEPSPAHIQEIHALVREHGITTVFSERLASDAMAKALSGDLGVTTGVLDPIEGLSEDTADQDYISLMRANLAALQEANGCS